VREDVGIKGRGVLVALSLAIGELQWDNEEEEDYRMRPAEGRRREYILGRQE
jgi:hypothetical protein